MQITDPFLQQLILALVAAGATIIGTVMGYFLSLRASRHASNLQEELAAKRDVYAPLFDELTRIVNELKESPWPDISEWRKINQNHLAYLLAELLGLVEHFYGNTLPNLQRKAEIVQRHYGDLISEDLVPKIPGFKFSKDGGLLGHVRRATCDGLLRGYLTPYEISTYGANYEQLKSAFGSKTQGSLQDYFQVYITKSKDDPSLADFHAFLGKAWKRLARCEMSLAKR